MKLLVRLVLTVVLLVGCAAALGALVPASRPALRAGLDRAGLSAPEAAARSAAFGRELGAAIAAAGYPTRADPAAINRPAVVALIFLLVFLLAVAYGPVAALLIELFPARIRNTSMSVPYHLGTGWFGGLTPAIAFAMVAYKGDIYFGLWFPVLVALATVVIGAICIPDRRDVDLSL